MIKRTYQKIAFAENECSDGMCCFTCVIPPGNGHVSFFKSLWKRGTAAPYVKLLVMSEGYKNELYDSCRFLDFIIYENPADSSMRMDLRCSIYKSRPEQCKGYPDKAGESLYKKISGPCIYNEYTAPGSYQKLVYKREWQAFYAIEDHPEALRNIFSGADAVTTARESLLKIKDVHVAVISQRKRATDYILIPLPKQIQNIMYLSEKHRPITSIGEACHLWSEKIQNNLQNHYGEEWERKLKNAIEMEEKDAGKRCDENSTGNAEC
ncbi:MAG: hypothetical protein ACUBOA_06365 [Candidatus Loosdrechtia sp.]|uniref:hypothetical protein n=1 Tax=Candidatus Loosdrechtia sp. TaxID=3101272 RepID=UPI003A70938D|nr:MAG: hypothetical protein QY305_14800 [Candidatus Jettenia sp. AMX2]